MDAFMGTPPIVNTNGEEVIDVLIFSCGHGGPNTLCQLGTLGFNSPTFRRRIAMKYVSIVRNGIGLGQAIAVAISWTTNQSLLWVIVHGILGWIYVVYYALGFGH
jgi:hypothetical protein